MTIPVTITEKALDEIKKIIQDKKIPEGYALRVGVKGGACGASFVLGFDTRQENDLEFEIDGITVFIQKKEVMFLMDKEIDFYEGADARGFSFN